MHGFIYARVGTRRYAPDAMHTSTKASIQIHAYIYTYTKIYTYMHTHREIHTEIHTYIDAYTHVRIVYPPLYQLIS